MLVNGGFDIVEGGGHDVLKITTAGELVRIQRGENTNPQGWITWMLHGKPVKHDDKNTVGWAEPESRPIEKKAPYLDPPRVRSGSGAVMLFTVHRIHDAGLYQQVKTAPGTKIRFSFFAHAWSSKSDNPKYSEGADTKAFYAVEGATLDDDKRNFTFYAGIDPTGGTNPFAATVEWGKGAHIYNAFAETQAVETIAINNTVTFFIRSRCLWAFKHCDAYIDDARAVVITQPPPPPPPPPPPDNGKRPVIATGSKFGYHVIKATSTALQLAAAVAGGAVPAVVKGVDDLGHLLDCKKASPKTRIIARFVTPLEGCGGVHDPKADLKEMARALMAPILDRISKVPALKDAVDYWEVANEPLGGGSAPETYVRLAQLMHRCAEIGTANGLKLVLFSFNAGTPEWIDMIAMAKGSTVWSYMVNNGHVLGFHEGVFGRDPVDKWWGEAIPGAPSIPPGAGPLCGRFKFFIEALKACNKPVPSMYITEFYPGGGRLADGMTPDLVINRMRWYDELVRQDPYVLGVTPFTWGGIGQWVGHDYGYIDLDYVSYMIRVKGLPNATFSDEPKPPPKETYDRVVHLIPQTATPGEFDVVRSAVWDKKGTITWSVDDAFFTGAGLASRTVHVWDVARVGGSKQALEAWVNEYWPPLPTVHYMSFAKKPAAPKILVGLHDEPSEAWRGAFGTFLIPRIVENRREPIDYRHLKPAGSKTEVIVRLNWSWARPTGKGTMPPPAQLQAHLDAVVATVLAAKGVDYWQLWNEPNNVREMPEDFTLSPEYIVAAYNTVYKALAGSGAKLSPPALDPKYGPGSDNRDWLRKILTGITGAGCLVLHCGKSQTNDPNEIWSNVKFSDHPLTWQFLNSKDLYTAMAEVPERFRFLPVILGEVNPQSLDTIGGKEGWKQGNAEWVKQFMEFARDWNAKMGPPYVSHVVFYRWGYDAWALERDPLILNTIKGESSK